MQEEFLALVAEERERGCAVFLSSHELDEVERVCDRVGIVRDGRLVAVERIADLLGKAPRRVTVEFAEPVDWRSCARCRGQRPRGRRRRVSFKVAGDLDPVVKAIAAPPRPRPRDDHPTLEEVFLTYYRGEER